MKIVAYKGRGVHPWRWRLVARNGRIIADSAEGYSKKSKLVRAIDRLRLGSTFPWVPVVWK